MKKPYNISYYSTSILGRLFDISREILSDHSLPSFSIPLPTPLPLPLSTPIPLSVPLPVPLSTSIPAKLTTFEQYNPSVISTLITDNHSVLCGVGVDSDVGGSPNNTDTEIECDMYGCDTLSYVDDSCVGVYTGNKGDAVCPFNADSRPYIPESQLQHATPATFLQPHPYPYPPLHPSPSPSPPLSLSQSIPTRPHPHQNTTTSISTSIPIPTIPRLSLTPTPLETLALDSIPMDLDLHTHRAGDFLEVAARLYTRYCTCCGVV